MIGDAETLDAPAAGRSSLISNADSPLRGDVIIRDVPDYLSIGEFSRATHMTVKTLRHYHEIGLLEPADVDPHTGYRRYSAEQIPTAQVVRRFRDLGMPLEEISLRNTHVADLSPLIGMPVKSIDLAFAPVLDFSPLTQSGPVLELVDRRTNTGPYRYRCSPSSRRLVRHSQRSNGRPGAQGSANRRH